MEEKAPEVSAGLKHNYVGTEHMMLAMTGMDLPLSEDPEINELFEFIFSMNANATDDALHGAILEVVIAYIPENLASSRPFTPRCKKLLAKSEEIAKRLKASAVTPLHFFFALMEEGNSVVVEVLWERFGIGFAHVLKAAARKTTADLLAGRPEPEFDLDLFLIIEKAKKVAIRRGLRQVKVSHLLQALADIATDAENPENHQGQ